MTGSMPVLESVAARRGEARQVSGDLAGFDLTSSDLTSSDLTSSAVRTYRSVLEPIAVAITSSPC